MATASLKQAESAPPEPGWPDDIHAALKAAGTRQVCHVPDAGHAKLIRLCGKDPSMTVLTLTTEEEGIGLGCGAWLGGQRSVLLMQSSGVGNCINALSMVRSCGLPFLALVSMRGQWGEFVPWQVPMGQASEAVMRAMGVIVEHVDEASRVGETVAAAARLAFDSSTGVAVLLSQRLIGTKVFTK
jgi:sulfopyruvate decarboxylase alpha subunit